MPGSFKFSGITAGLSERTSGKGNAYGILSVSDLDQNVIELAVFGHNFSQAKENKDGVQVEVTGKVGSRAYTDKNGVQRYGIQLSVHEDGLKFAGKSEGFSAAISEEGDDPLGSIPF